MKCISRRGRTVRVRGLFAFAAAALLVMFAAGCAPTFQLCPPGLAPALREEGPAGWWYAAFKIRWPEGEGPSMYIDSLIAHRIAVPVLERYKNEIRLWRFHRRAARDKAGHRFSLVLYCPPATARKAFSDIDSSVVLEEMKAAGLILKVDFDSTKKITRPDIEGVSDPSWSRPLQKSWPWFIMGVSRTWLDLIDQFANDGRQKPFSLDGMIEFHCGIDQSVRETWMKEGAHAYLHHLNALFGYGPVTVRGKGQMRF